MKTILNYLLWRVGNHVHNILSLDGVFNLLLGFVICAVCIFFLKKGAKKEGSYYTFCKNQVFPTCFWLMLGMVLLAPPLPMKEHTLLGVLAYTIFYIVFSVTSFTDKQTGFFTAGYMMVGVFLNLVLALICLPGWIKEGNLSNLIGAAGVIGANLIFGTFAYRFGDALLYLMAQCLMMICLPSDLWVASMIVGLFSAFVYSIVWYGGAFVKNEGNKKSRFPFTTCLFLGSLTALFLFH